MNQKYNQYLIFVISLSVRIGLARGGLHTRRYGYFLSFNGPIKIFCIEFLDQNEAHSKAVAQRSDKIICLPSINIKLVCIDVNCQIESLLSSMRFMPYLLFIHSILSLEYSFT